MQLETYISDLLYRYECVTIPEFGAFLTQRVSATIDESSNAFYPPKKLLSFNEQIQINDGLLAHYIADVEKIPFEVANKKITKRVKLLKSYLTQGETLTFNNIGEIVFNNEGKILFEPKYQLNYLTDSFGLSRFESTIVNREHYKKTAEAVENVIPIGVTPEKRKSKSFLKYAAVALIALTVGGIAASNFYVNKIKTHNQLAQEQASQQLETKIQQATFSLNTLPAITLNVTKQIGNYHIIAGAFRVEENCNKKVDQLRKEGFTARKIGANKYGLHQVVYASYEDRLEALRALRNIKKTHNKDAWLMVEDLSKIKSSKISIKKEHLKTEQFKSSNVGTYSGKELSKSSESLPTENNPNIIPIIKNDRLESGFYLILGAFSDYSEKNLFLDELDSKGYTNTTSFFDKNSKKFLVFNEKFKEFNAAKNAFTQTRNKQNIGKSFIVKVEN